MYSIESKNEIEASQHGRYLSTNEVIWEIFGFPTQDKNPSVQHLAVHLENDDRVCFTKENPRELAENPKNTTRMAFFNLQQR